MKSFIQQNIWVILIFVVIVVTLKIENILRKFIIRLKILKGKKGESIARDLLLKKGFKILKEQPEIETQMWVNNKSVTYKIKVDFLVKKGREISIVEVKNGKSVSNPEKGITRRQLFEYFHVYNADKLYFIDAQKKTMVEIYFPSCGGIKKSPLLWLFRILVAVGLVMLFYFIGKIFGT